MKQTLSEIYNLLNKLTITGIENAAIVALCGDKLKQVYNEIQEGEENAGISEEQG